jgi:hypothetical protein
MGTAACSCAAHPVIRLWVGRFWHVVSAHWAAAKATAPAHEPADSSSSSSNQGRCQHMISAFQLICMVKHRRTNIRNRCLGLTMQHQGPPIDLMPLVLSPTCAWHLLSATDCRSR